MIEQKIKQAQEAVAILDQASSIATLNRQEHFRVQMASQFLKALLTEEEKAWQPPEPVEKEAHGFGV